MTETYKLVYDKYDAKVAQILTQTGMRHDACNSRLLLKTYFLPRNVRRCGLCCRSVSVCPSRWLKISSNCQTSCSAR